MVATKKTYLEHACALACSEVMIFDGCKSRLNFIIELMVTSADFVLFLSVLSS